MKTEKNTAPDAIYEMIFWYLENRSKRQMAERLLFGNLHRFEKTLSWTMDETHLKLLDRSVNDRGSIDDTTRKETQHTFIIEAFKDLSSLRNPNAMKVFQKLRSLFVNDGSMLLWGRKVIERADGSAVLVVHVSDLGAFEKVLHDEVGRGYLEEGLIIWR